MRLIFLTALCLLATAGPAAASSNPVIRVTCYPDLGYFSVENLSTNADTLGNPQNLKKIWKTEGLLLDTGDEEWTKTCKAGKELKLSGRIKWGKSEGPCGAAASIYIRLWLDKKLIADTGFSEICGAGAQIDSIIYDNGLLTLEGSFLLSAPDKEKKDDLVRLTLRERYDMENLSERTLEKLPITHGTMIEDAKEAFGREKPDSLIYELDIQ